MPLPQLLLAHPQHWHQVEGDGLLACRGFIYARTGELQTGAELASHLAQELSPDPHTLPQQVARLNGCFAFYWQPANRPWSFAAVDKARSIPLFYNSAQVSDTVDITGGSLDPVQVDLFPYTGHSLGPNTLFQEWSQLQAGEVVLWTADADPQCVSYFQPVSEERESPLSSLWSASLAVFERLVESHQDQTFVVPLSGGYDSRLIASMLKHLNCEKVLCYTYGRKEGFEAKISRQVAENLGYPWHFIPYDTDTLRSYLSEEGLKYQQFAGAGTCLAHEQDWVAVKEMKTKGLIPPNSVFLPGFGGDVMAGSWYPRVPLLQKAEVVDYLVSAEKFFSGKRVKDFNQTNAAQLISKELEPLDISDMHSAFQAIQYWGWRNRMTKFLVNSVRVYEYWGYEWRLPFFDSEWIDTWLPLPDRHKPGKAAYLEMANRQLFEPLGVAFSQPSWKPDGWKQQVKRLLPATWIDWFKGKTFDPDMLDTTNARPLAELFCEEMEWPITKAQTLSINYIMAHFYLKFIQEG